MSFLESISRPLHTSWSHYLRIDKIISQIQPCTWVKLVWGIHNDSLCMEVHWPPVLLLPSFSKQGLPKTNFRCRIRQSVELRYDLNMWTITTASLQTTNMEIVEYSTWESFHTHLRIAAGKPILFVPSEVTNMKWFTLATVAARYRQQTLHLCFQLLVQYELTKIIIDWSGQADFSICICFSV